MARTVSFSPNQNKGPGNASSRFLKAKEKPKNLKSTLKRLWGVLGEGKKGVKIVFILVFISTLVDLAVPYLIGKSVDVLEVSKIVDMSLLQKVLFVLFLAYITSGILGFFQEFTMAKISQLVVKNIRKILFNKFQKLAISYYDTHFSGDIMSRVTNDIDNISITISSSVPTLMNSLISIIGSFIIMIVLSPILTLASLISVPLIFLLTRIISKRTRKLFKEQQQALGKLNSCIEESVSGILEVKAFTREEKIKEEFEVYNNEYREVGFKAQLWSGYLMPMINVINNLSFAMVATIGGVLSIKGVITIGLIASFLSYSRQFVRPLNNLANIFNTIQSALAGAERVFEVLDEEEELEDLETVVELKEVKGDIDFENVTFGYNENKTVLKNINYKVKSGESIAIVGETGSGKTTLINLLTRFYEISEGSIKIDGIDLRNYSRESLRNSFSVVLQDTYLFSGTILENVAYGNREATREEIIEACKVANAHYFIKRLKRGYNTVISEGGISLSSGQRQLIAIARAVLSNKPILILDEATSNVDTRTELKIQEALLKLMKGRTTFIIAHRLSTIRDADKIIVISGGEIIESGRHDELLKLGGYYYNLYSI